MVAQKENSEVKLTGDKMDVSSTAFVYSMQYVTYSAIAQKFDHAQGLFDIWDLLFEPTSPLRQVAVHIAVLPTENNRKRRRERGRKGQKK